MHCQQEHTEGECEHGRVRVKVEGEDESVERVRVKVLKWCEER